MKVLIAGGSGLIGRALCRLLLEHGYAVAVLTRNPHEVDLPDGVEAIAWDGKTAQGWGSRVPEFDAIINLAGANIGALPWTKARKQLIRQSRQEAGQAIVAAVQQAEKRPAVVLQNAGTGYYGAQQGDHPLNEEVSAGGDYLSGVAIDWEESVRPLEDLGVRLAIMRSGAVLTPTGGMLKPFILQHRLFSGGPLGSGRQWISWIHVHDLIQAMLFLLEQPDAGGVFNVTSPYPVTNAEFGRTMGKVMRRPYWLPVPAFALYAVLGEMSTIVLTGQRVVPKRLLEMGFRFRFGRLEAALEDLLKARSPNG